MAVNLQEKVAKELYPIDGVQFYVGQAGLKYPQYDDVTVMVISPSSSVAAVFTQNRFCAAPVRVAKKHLLLNKGVRALIINTGYANAGTGQTGLDNCQAVCAAVALQINCDVEQVLPFSTGVILEALPTEKIINVLPKIKPAYWDAAAKAIMTTDTVAKSASVQKEINGEIVSFTGIAKGSGMICPNMATMLGFIATDATIEQQLLNQLIKEVADESFNCITVDGDTSTNDAFVIIATGKSKLVCVEDSTTEAYLQVKAALVEVALELATAIIRDGEGASKFITIKVRDAQNTAEARKVAYAIAHSPLVKTAFNASDANLGRILCAIGYAGIDDLDVDDVRLFLDNILVAENGARAELYQEEDGQRVMSKDEITVRVELQRGDSEATVYTCDFSHEYITINADYRS